MWKPLLLLPALLLLSSCAGLQSAAPYKTETVKNKGNFKVGNPYKVEDQWYHPKETYRHTETGIASWYGPGFDGKRTANGERFNKRELTAAHRTLQMPSLVRVTNLDNGKSIVVRINDRGPFKRGRVIDVSERAAELLGFKSRGMAKVRLDVLENESRKLAMAARGGHHQDVMLATPVEKVPGHLENGQFFPDAVVTTQPVHFCQNLYSGRIF